MHDLIKEAGRAPTINELRLRLALSSTNGVVDHLCALERKGFIVREYRTARSLIITQRGLALIDAPADATAPDSAPVGRKPRVTPSKRTPWWMTGTIYVIEAVGSGRVKIGFTKGPVAERMSSLQTACPFPLRAIATIPGNYSREAALHIRFASCRIAQLEWFVLTPELQSFIDAANSIQATS